MGRWGECSVQGARYWARNFLRHLRRYGISSINQITADILERYHRERISALSPCRQHKEFQFLTSLFKWCVQKGVLIRSPLPAWKLPPISQVTTYLSVEQVQTVLKSINTCTHIGLRDRAMVEMFYCTAIRRRELIHLDICDVDFVNARLWIHHGKGNKERIVPVHRIALTWVCRYLEDSRPLLARAGRCEALFISRNGKRIDLSMPVKLFQSLQKATGINRLSAHIMRHSCATHLMDAGVPLPYLQKFLGHSKIETTQRYLHLGTPQMKKIYDKAHPRDKWDLEKTD